MGLTWLCEINLNLLCYKGLIEDIILIVVVVPWSPITSADVAELVSTSAGNTGFL